MTPERKQQILDLANDEWVDRLPLHLKDDYAAFDRIGREMDKERRRFVRTCSVPEELHYFAECWNWDGSNASMLEVAKNPHCDAGTALLIYWRANPEHYVKCETVDDVDDYGENPELFKLIKTIERRYASGLYKGRRLAYDPQADVGIGRYAEQAQSRRLPEKMYEPVIPVSKGKRGRPTLQQLVELIASCKSAEALRMLVAAPELARISLDAPSGGKSEKFFERVMHYAYAGDTALHLAAAAYDVNVIKALLKRGARVGARNRRGAEPLHYASDGHPDAPAWNPKAQAATIALLLKAAADANVLDKSGVAPLHRAARTRCSAAVRALLVGGAKAKLRSESGSTARQLAEKSTGRGGSGSAAAKREQALILKLLQA